MAFSGGDIIEVTAKHPSLGSFTFFPKSGEESTYNKGGFRTDDDMENIAGDGTAINTLVRNRWAFEVPMAWDMNDTNELDNLVALAGSTEDADWTFTNINGSVWAGNGRPVGELPGNGKSATIPLKVSGGGLLEKIV